ncbi:MAG: YebC/PmpR family DNA-binding transcriptional regulator [Oscillospiraceae bacterium]|nr:YebC/PmpR family DNA-binding transcriptional regulator [Oscillospiraceae bacterium]
MSGHSKWSTIKRKKEATDSKRANVFTKIGREIAVAVREGGGDPNSNSKLRDLVAKAKANNVPNENVERIIKKAMGDGDKNDYEEMTYEGYGPCGVAVMVEALTDNRNRTAGDLRHYFDKCGGNLGQNGSVSFLFEQKGIIAIENEDGKISEDKIFEDAMLDGVIDIKYEDGGIEIVTEPAECRNVRIALEALGYAFASAEVEYVPTTLTKIDDPEQAQKMQKLIDLLEENDDVQEVYTSWDMPEEEGEE